MLPYPQSSGIAVFTLNANIGTVAFSFFSILGQITVNQCLIHYSVSDVFVTWYSEISGTRGIFLFSFTVILSLRIFWNIGENKDVLFIFGIDYQDCKTVNDDNSSKNDIKIFFCGY